VLRVPRREVRSGRCVPLSTQLIKRDGNDRHACECVCVCVCKRKRKRERTGERETITIIKPIYNTNIITSLELKKRYLTRNDRTFSYLYFANDFFTLIIRLPPSYRLPYRSSSLPLPLPLLSSRPRQVRKSSLLVTGIRTFSPPLQHLFVSFLNYPVLSPHR